MKTHTRRLTILLTLTIIASGCTGGGGGSDETSGDTAISVESFEASPNPATADRRATVNLELKNTGSTEAERVAARIFGPSWADGAGDTLSWRNSSGGEVLTSERTLFYGNLRAPGENSPSVPKIKNLGLTAPDLSEGRQIDTTFKTKIFYDYETSSSADIRILSSERFREEGLSKKEANLDNSKGPIQLDIRGTTPKIFYKDSPNIDSEICVEVRNTGDGRAFIGGQVGDADDESRVWQQNPATDYKENTVKLNITDIGNIDFESNDGGGQTAEVELINGKNGFTCFSMESTEGLAGQDLLNVNVFLTADYNYVKEDSTSVTVEGNRN